MATEPKQPTHNPPPDQPKAPPPGPKQPAKAPPDDAAAGRDAPEEKANARPGEATTAATDADAPRPVKARTPVTSGGPEAWAIPHTPSRKADIDAAIGHAEDHLRRMADKGTLPESLQRPRGPAPKAGKTMTRGAGPADDPDDPWDAVAKAEARVKGLVADATAVDAAGEAKARATGAPPPRGWAVQQHSMSREEMQANGITDDMLCNADGLGVPRLLLFNVPEMPGAIQDYIDACHTANG